MAAVPQETTTLYHYTDVGGLHGILKSGAFRFGDARFLNDETEFVHGMNVARSVLDHALQETDNEEILVTTKRFLAPEMVFRRLYVFSLSETSESISQWQRYGADGHGYCLGFDLSRLQQLFSGRATLRRLIYDHDEQFGSLQGTLADALDNARARGYNIPGLTSVGGAVIAVALEEVVLQFKNASFEDEHEWRLIVDVDADTTDEVVPSFEPRGFYVKPFVDVSVANNESIRLPLVSVTCGPRLDPEFAELSVRNFLDAVNLPSVQVRRSRLRGTWR